MATMIQANSKDVRLFSAIAAMGIPWTQESAAVAGGERTWLFGEISDCGKWKIKDLLSWWRDSGFHVKNPSHPFNVVKCVMASDKGIREAVTRHLGIRQRKVGDSFVIETIDDEGSISFSNRSTNDIAFISALSAYGFNIYESKKVGDIRFFSVSDRSTCGDEYEKVKTWWLDKSFERNNPQHLFSYAKAASLTYQAAVESIRKERELVKWKPSGANGFAYIHPDCSSKTEEKVRGWLYDK